jgi:hypothetical protein
MRNLVNSEISLIENKIEKFLSEEIFSWDILDLDKSWNGVGESMEEKVIKEIINVLKNRIDYY